MARMYSSGDRGAAPRRASKKVKRRREARGEVERGEERRRERGGAQRSEVTRARRAPAAKTLSP
eukprot:6034568-Pleurochrysis_carterae.AAC.3